MELAEYKQIIDGIREEMYPYFGKGRVADYIPALSEVEPRQFGMAVATVDGGMVSTGDSLTRFSIQSVSKVFTLAMVVRHLGDDIWKSVGREPSGTPFNSLIQLERENGKPRNPFINAGALVITDRMMDLYDRPKDTLLRFLRQLSSCDDVYFDRRVAVSEIEHADRNRALGYFMKSFGNIHNDVETLIDIYCHQCSVTMNCEELARAFRFLANRGVNPSDGERILSESMSKRLNALMLTCGFYDESGDFAFRVGMPGKSGVGGAVGAVIPGVLSVAVWSPELDVHGNSLIGMEALERFTSALGVSIF